MEAYRTFKKNLLEEGQKLIFDILPTRAMDLHAFLMSGDFNIERVYKAAKTRAASNIDCSNCTSCNNNRRAGVKTGRVRGLVTRTSTSESESSTSTSDSSLKSSQEEELDDKVDAATDDKKVDAAAPDRKTRAATQGKTNKRVAHNKKIKAAISDKKIEDVASGTNGAAPGNKVKAIASDKKVEATASSAKVRVATSGMKVKATTSGATVDAATPGKKVETAAFPRRVKAASSGVKVESMTSEISIPPINSAIVNLLDRIQPYALTTITDARKIVAWIKLHEPKIEEGGDKLGVEIQEEAESLAKALEARASQFHHTPFEYFSQRGVITRRIRKNAGLKDFEQALREFDMEVFFDLRLAVEKLRDYYCHLYEFLTVNIDKIRRPREQTDNSTMY